MPTTCEINFENNPQKICFSGQKLHITVRLKLTEEIKIRGIYIHLRGTAHVRFVVDDAGRGGNFTTDEDVLNIRKYLVDGKGDVQVIPMGTYDYSFTCTLPDNLPSSFSSEFGHIKYTANVIISIPRWPDKKFPSKFFVIKPLNLNDMPSLREADIYKFSQCVGNIYSVGIIGIAIQTSAGGYVCGQTINLNVTVTNTTHFPVGDFILSLLRKTVYHKSADSKHQKTEYVVVNKRHVSDCICECDSCKTFPMSIKIPAMVPPSDTKTSKIIKISYLISVKCLYDDYQSYEGAVKCKAPITIGTIPFDGSASAIFVPLSSRMGIVPSAPHITMANAILPSAPLLPSFEPSAPNFPDDDTISIRTYTSTPPPFPDDDDFDLPTYHEAVLMDQDIDINVNAIEESFAKLYTETTK